MSSSPDITTTNEAPSSQNSIVLKGFIPLICLTEVTGLLALILLITWSFSYLEGMSKFQTESKLGWHPFLMTLGLIYLMGNAVLIFRLLREWPMKRLKLIHAWIHGIVLILVASGLFLIIDYHNSRGMNNFYSVHSWIGLITVVLFILQLSFGFFAFLYPVFGQSTRSTLLPFHVYLGKTILIMAIGAAATGINELAIFKIQRIGPKHLITSYEWASFFLLDRLSEFSNGTASLDQITLSRRVKNVRSIFFCSFIYATVNVLIRNDYHNYPRRGLILNVASILFILFGVLVIYITNKPHYKRQARPVDMAPTRIISSPS